MKDQDRLDRMDELRAELEALMAGFDSARDVEKSSRTSSSRSSSKS